MEVKLHTASDTAYILRRELGPIYSWDDFLADGRKNDKDHTGPMLFPSCGILHGKQRRPYYSVRDIAEFILMMRRTRADTRANHIEAVKVDLSPAEQQAHWKLVSPKIRARAGASAAAH